MPLPDNRERVFTYDDPSIPLVERLRYTGWTWHEFLGLARLAAEELETRATHCSQLGGCVGCPKCGRCSGYEVHERGG